MDEASLCKGKTTGANKEWIMVCFPGDDGKHKLHPVGFAVFKTPRLTNVELFTHLRE
jgi:hypothetical protein